jgi:mono/diheme cytochrome c family protein
MRLLPAAAAQMRRRLLSSPLTLISRGLVATFILVPLLLSACARKPLPEAGTPIEQLYAQRCGTCHRAYQPSTLTPAMWELQVDAMQLKINAAGMPTLTPADKQTILAYLERHASSPQ